MGNVVMCGFFWVVRKGDPYTGLCILKWGEAPRNYMQQEFHTITAFPDNRPGYRVQFCCT